MYNINLNSKTTQAKLYVYGVSAHTDGDNEDHFSHYKVLDIRSDSILVVFGSIDWNNRWGSILNYNPHILKVEDYGKTWRIEGE